MVEIRTYVFCRAGFTWSGPVLSPGPDYIIACIYCLVTISWGRKFDYKIKQIKTILMAGKLKTEELVQRCHAALRLFSRIIGQVWPFFFPPTLTATLHFAWKPSILQILDFFWVLFLYTKHHYTSGSWSHYYGRRKRLCVSNYLTLSEADCRPLSSDNRITA